MVKLLVIVCFIFLLSCSDNKKSIFKEDKQYYTITNDGIQKLKFQNDSLFFVRVFEPVYDAYNYSDEKEDIERTIYRIKEFETIEDKTILFLQNEQTKDAVKKCFLLFDSTKEKVSLLLEDTHFNSIKSAQKYKPDFDKKYLLTFYSKALMNKYSYYKSIFTLDSIEKTKVVNEFVENVLGNKEKINNTKVKGIEFLAVRAITTSCFLKNNLTPFVDIDSFSLLLKNNKFIKNLSQ